MVDILNKILATAKKSYSVLDTIASFGSNPLADLSLLEEGLTPWVNPVDDQCHKALVERLLISYHKSKAEQKNSPPIYKPNNLWDANIKTVRADYLESLNSYNATALGNLLRDFFRNSGIAGSWTYEHYKDVINGSTLERKRFINCILQDFATWKDFVEDADIDSLSTPPVGNPWGYIIKGNLVAPVSCRHHYYASHVSGLLADVDLPVIAEIGGGFGGFAYYLLSSGKRNKYIGFDLPEVLLIQQYYLVSNFPERKFLLFGEIEDRGITVEAINHYDIILMPNFQLPKLSSDSIDLFINTCSLSEMDYRTVKEYISQIARTAKLYFFHSNSDKRTNSRSTEILASEFPIPSKVFRRIYKSISPWGGGGGRYRDYLYRRVQ